MCVYVCVVCVCGECVCDGVSYPVSLQSSPVTACDDEVHSVCVCVCECDVFLTDDECPDYASSRYL